MVAVLPTTRLARWAARIHALPPWAWLAAQAAALWPHWRWAWARVNDGSDDPLGLVAALAWLAIAWRMSPRMAAEPRPGWLALALATTVAATTATVLAPPLVGALLAAIAMAAGLRAWLPAGTPSLPTLGLAVLSLPVVSSLQFYAGYPLRVLTAQLSTWALQAIGFVAERSGASMIVEGRLVIVDAPCSGVQMAWFAYFTACVMAWQAGRSDGEMLRRLPAVGALVLAGNAVRNSVLVGLEARRVAVAPWLHEAIGLATLATVCIGVAAVMHKVYNTHKVRRIDHGENLA